MQETASYCPASLSFIFRYCPDQNLAKMGSIGVGCALDKGVITRVKMHQYTSIMLNNTPLSFPTVNYVIRSLAPSPVMVKIISSLPLGYGFGISGAAALACAFALNNLFKLGKSNLELAKIAHKAEIINNTGLGSVGTQFTGGFLIKTAPGIPVRAISLPFVGSALYATIIGKLETASVLKDTKKLKKINQAADWALHKIKKGKVISLPDIIETSLHFAKKSLLLQNKLTTSLIEKIRMSGGCATMAMLGQVVVSTTKPHLQNNYPVEKLTISKKSACLL